MQGASRAGIALVLILAVSSSTAAASASPFKRTSERIAPGIRLVRLVGEREPVRAYVLRVVMGRSFAIEPALAGRAYPSQVSTVELASHRSVLAAVNGDMGDGRPNGAFAVNSTLVSSGLVGGNVVALGADGSLARVGRPRLRVVARSDLGWTVRVPAWNAGQPSGSDVVGFTATGGLLEVPPTSACSVRLLPADTIRPSTNPTWRSTAYVVDERACADRAMEIGRGVVLSSRRTGAGARWMRSLTPGAWLEIAWRSRWPRTSSFQGGRPMLVHHGHVVVSAGCRDLFCLRQPRTGVGIGAGCLDRDVETHCITLLTVVDGRRRGWSAGMTLIAFARLMRRVGAVEALNMDGGGSSQLVVSGQVVNRPSERPLRAVPSGWVVRPA